MQSDVPNEAARGALQPSPGPDNTFYAYHEPESPAEFSTTVVHALADLMDVDVSEMELSLAEFVDPDALDRLFAATAADGDVDDAPLGHVAFSVEGYRVTVYSDGQIVLTPPDSAGR